MNKKMKSIIREIKIYPSILANRIKTESIHFNKKAIQQWRIDTEEQQSYNKYLNDTNKETNEVRFNHLFYKNLFQFYLKLIKCIIVGHNIICTDEGGPEGGSISGHCDCCGYSYHHRLY